MYIDGHERDDVVAYRGEYIEYITNIENNHLPPPAIESVGPVPPPPKGAKYLVILDHDESTFFANDDQPVAWVEPGTQCIKPKTRGTGIMVSDFIDEFDGSLKLSDSEYEKAKQQHPEIQQSARVLLEIGVNKEGYWDNKKLMQQVEQAATIASQVSL